VIEDGLGDAEGPLEVDRDDRVPQALVHLAQGLVAQDAGVVDQDVHLAEGVEGLLEDPLPALDGGDVVVARGGHAAGVADLLRHGVGHRLAFAAAISGPAQVVHQHLRALGGQRQRVLAPDAAPRAGHDRNLAVQQTHAVVLRPPRGSPGS
jgi:hypothetical protein